eukprot:TRINITY_DN711_c0_g1_i1.p1 TRINITY_DN711_c0_g1~~TRINITY_DN711_c0_g1_i1.p1  ORF type:complete len:619 (+),score=123.91 TRINITY_DN711_c0_g1_i1:80-1858(+)
MSGAPDTSPSHDEVSAVEVADTQESPSPDGVPAAPPLVGWTPDTPTARTEPASDEGHRDPVHPAQILSPQPEQDQPAFRPFGAGVGGGAGNTTSARFLSYGSAEIMHLEDIGVEEVPSGIQKAGHDDKERPTPPPPQPVRRVVEAKEQEDGPPWKIILFTTNLLVGLAGSQTLPESHVYSEIVGLSTMFCLSFIMIGVGYEFEIDKSQMKEYQKDFAVAMSAAMVPWLLGAVYFMVAVPDPLPWDQALAIAIFSAPTSAGILFSMLEAAGLKPTWLFRKARVLAIFDDLGTILLLIPIKIMVVGPQWELSIVLLLMGLLLLSGWVRLHKVQLPHSWQWTLVYAFCVTAFSETLHIVTKDHLPMEAVHLEVLLPAFVMGVVIRTSHSIVPEKDPDGAQPKEPHPSEEHGHSETEERVQTVLSALFMVFVGLSMPKLFGTSFGSSSGSSASEDDSGGMGAALLVVHVAAMTLLMIAGKMFLLLFYSDEAPFRSRLALSVGMCPRGEVGAGVIVVALESLPKEQNVQDAITISVLCLALNLVLSGWFIMMVKRLARGPKELPPPRHLRVNRPASPERMDPEPSRMPREMLQPSCP